jgi:ATP-dependent Lhr-like helicase
MLRNPPDILITTPESLYLMLTSQAREMLRGVETVIVDEIHAVAHQARRAPGAHARAARRARAGRDAAAHRALGDAAPARGDRRASSSGPRRAITIVDAGVAQGARPRDRRAGRVDGRARRASPALGRRPRIRSGRRGDATLDLAAIYPELLELVREHRSTIVFVNNRRALALRRAARAAPERARGARSSRSPAPTTARSRASSARRSRSC